MKIEDIKCEIPEVVIDEKDFDIEKWRLENPMDYFKAMYLIDTSLNKNEVFMSIYKVTRLYIPDILFKYYSLTDNLDLNEKKLETLLQKKIFMSEAKYLNDPFDNKAYFYKPDLLKKYKRLEPVEGKIIDDFTRFSKVTSLTSNGVNSMPMWAHYANNHNGFCVSYDMKNNVQLSGCTFPVQYTDERIDITSLMDKQIQKIIQEINIQTVQGKKQILMNDLSMIYLTSYFCNIKHISWSYEKEFRCSVASNAKGMPYISATPKEIYVGMKCPETYVDKLVKIANTLQIPIYKMKFNEFDEEFNLSYEKIQ